MNTPTTDKTILLVDPCLDLREMIQFILASVGYDVLAVGNGADALHLAQETSKIDLLLSEVVLPDMRGEHMAAKFAVIQPETPVIFATDCWKGAIDTGESFEILPKPFTIAELRQTVSRAMGMDLRACYLLLPYFCSWKIPKFQKCGAIISLSAAAPTPRVRHNRIRLKALI
jgi:DNA-binding NtrC family response regulator